MGPEHWSLQRLHLSAPEGRSTTSPGQLLHCILTEAQLTVGGRAKGKDTDSFSPKTQGQAARRLVCCGGKLSALESKSKVMNVSPTQRSQRASNFLREHIF